MSVIGRVAGEGVHYCMVAIYQGQVVFLPPDAQIPSLACMEIVGIFPCTFEDYLEDPF